jgi:hypothetical protein
MRSVVYCALSLSYGSAGRKGVSHPVAATYCYGVERRVHALCGGCSNGYVSFSNGNKPCLGYVNIRVTSSIDHGV